MLKLRNVGPCHVDIKAGTNLVLAIGCILFVAALARAIVTIWNTITYEMSLVFRIWVFGGVQKPAGKIPKYLGRQK